MPNYFTVEKEIQFDAGHRVPNHKSKCRNPHGHRYRVVVGVVGDLHHYGSNEGMVMDFGDIKETLTKLVHDVFDHSFIVFKDDVKMVDFLTRGRDNWKVNVVSFVPTAEEMARHLYEVLVTELNGLAYVKVWETPTSVAIYPVQRVGTVMIDEDQ